MGLSEKSNFKVRLRWKVCRREMLNWKKAIKYKLVNLRLRQVTYNKINLFLPKIKKYSNRLLRKLAKQMKKYLNLSAKKNNTYK